MPKHRMALGLALFLVLSGSFLPLAPRAPFAAESSPTAFEAGLSVELDRLEQSELEVTLNFEDVDLDSLLRSLHAVTGVEFHTDDPDLKGKTVTVRTPRIPLKTALIQIAVQHGLEYDVLDVHTLRVRSSARPAEETVIVSPRPIKGSQVVAEYPDWLREAGVEGRVILQARIDATGGVTEVELLQTTRPEYPALAEAAIDAVRQWRYEPATRDGVPVAAFFTVVMEFTARPEPDGTL